jgi:hypothetical protein
MRKYLFVFLILLTACVPAGPQQSPAVQTENSIPTTAPTDLPAVLPPTPTTSSQPQSEATAAPQTPVASTSGPLWVKVLSHQDGDTVNTPTITIKGQAPVDAVVTVNDDIVLVSNDQSFEAEVKLETGPNLIEIVASDLNGNEVYLPLTIDYEP